MGLNCSHDAWDGAYSAFMTWRKKIAEVSGLPPLELMNGFYNSLDGGGALPTLYHGDNTKEPMFGGEYKRRYMDSLDSMLPIDWDCLKPNALHELLYHSDCDGEIAAEDCSDIADELEKIIPDMPDGEAGGHIGNWRDTTAKFVDGLRLASEKNEPLGFH